MAAADDRRKLGEISAMTYKAQAIWYDFFVSILYCDQFNVLTYFLLLPLLAGS